MPHLKHVMSLSVNKAVGKERMEGISECMIFPHPCFDFPQVALWREEWKGSQIFKTLLIHYLQVQIITQTNFLYSASKHWR